MITRYLPPKLTLTLAIALACAHSPVLAGEAAATGILEATGAGTVDMAKATNKIQARMMAKRAARVDAQRNLLEVVEGVRVTAGTTVKDAQLESDLIANRVKGMLKGAFVIAESVEEMEDSYYAEVQLGVCLDGSDTKCRQQPTLAQILHAGLARNADAEPFTAEVSEDAAAQPVTGLIVDLSGMGFARYLDVRIRNEGGKELYGPAHFDASRGRDWLHWADSVDSARGMTAVVGDAPIVVTAQEIRDASRVILSEEAATSVYTANARNGDFLGSGNVVLVVN